MNAIIIHESPASHDPADRFTEREIIDAMARTLFVHAWAEYMLEQYGQTYSECNLCAIAPHDTDPAAYHGAQTLVHDLVSANGGARLARLWDRCQSDDLEDYEAWAERVALQWLGTGVAWDDCGGNSEAEFKVPHGEFGSHSLQNDYDRDGNLFSE